jgi:c-di-GMP-binding flagellar brake protein YcgR
MARTKIAYSNFFKVGQQVKLGMRLSENLIREGSGELTFFEDDRTRVELFGADVPAAFASLKPGTRLNLSGWSGWGFFNCAAILEEALSAKDFIIRLTGIVEEIQRREYFRLDVSLPVVIRKPLEQTITSLNEQWEEIRAKHLEEPPPQLFSTLKGYRAVTFDRQDIAPQGVNLSGGGMRLRLTEKIFTGDRVHADIYLPVAPARIVPVVAEVLRCNELALRIQKDPAYITAMKFLTIDEKDRELIIAYLFAEQRILLQNEAEERELPTPT